MKYDIWGIRFDNKEYKIGDELPKSRRWEDGSLTDELLDGTSTIYVSSELDFLDYLDGEEEEIAGELNEYREALKQERYNAKHIYLVAGRHEWGVEWGEDENEVVINGAEVVRVIK